MFFQRNWCYVLSFDILLFDFVELDILMVQVLRFGFVDVYG